MSSNSHHLERAVTSDAPRPHERPRLVNVHIGKAAGTWLRTNIQSNFSDDEICVFRFENEFNVTDPDKYMDKKFFSAHIGHELACRIGGDRITVLRNPFDRMLSLYYYWNEVPGAPDIVQGMNLKDFFLHRHHVTMQDVDNAQTWQLAFGNTLQYRHQHRSISKDELLARAIENLTGYAVVGIYEDFPLFCARLNQRFNFNLSPVSDKVNTTKLRPRDEPVTMEIRNLIYERNDLDVALYEHVVKSCRQAVS